MYTDKLRRKSHAPRIGILEDDSNTDISRASNAGAKRLVEEAGGIAVPLKYFDPADENWHGNALNDLDNIDGLIVLGNKSDIDPTDFNQKQHPKTHLFTNKSDKARAAYEKEMLPAALEKKLPMFMVCAGMQRLNIVLGGTLHQHIPDLLEGNNKHSSNNGHVDEPHITTQPVEILQGTSFAETLERMAQSKKKVSADFDPANPYAIMANSLHHQAIDKLGDGLRVSAYATDVNSDGTQIKIIEAVETDPNGKFAGQFIQGRQWHPELSPQSDISKNMFGEFVAVAAEYAKQQGRDNSHAAALHAGRDSGNHPSL